MIDTTRRGLIGGFLAGTLLIGTPAFASMPDRYRELVSAQHDLIALVKVFYSTPTDTSTERQKATDIGIDAAFERVMVVLNERFNDYTPIQVNFEGTRAKVQDVLYNRISINTLDENDLRRYEDVLICVAVARSLLQYHRVPVKASSPGWRKLADDLKKIIL